MKKGFSKEKSQLKNLIFNATAFIGFSLILSSCTDKVDNRFCECLKATEDMDEITSNFMGGDVSEEEWKEVKEISKIMNSTCKDYVEISMEEELRLKEQCENH